MADQVRTRGLRDPACDRTDQRTGVRFVRGQGVFNGFDAETRGASA